jgi:hypothetical protein
VVAGNVDDAMSSKIWVFLAVTLVSIGAGVAVAGIPSRDSADLSDLTSVPSLTVTATSVESTPAPSPATVDETTPVSATTEPEPTAPDTTSTTAAPSESLPDTIAESTDTTVVASPTTRAPVARTELPIVVVNGAGIAGVARRTADALQDLGYPPVRTLDGIQIVGATAVFAAAGFQAEAEQLAIDAGLGPGSVFPISAVPEFSGGEDEPLILYLGADVATL